MFCDYCRRLFEFRQTAVQPYEPPQKAPRGLLKPPETSPLTIEQGNPPSKNPRIEVCKDVKDIFSPRLMWWKVPIDKNSLSNATQSPRADCQICAMIFSNASSSLVEALLQRGNGGKQVAFVYQLKSEAASHDSGEDCLT